MSRARPSIFPGTQVSRGREYVKATCLLILASTVLSGYLVLLLSSLTHTDITIDFLLMYKAPEVVLLVLNSPRLIQPKSPSTFYPLIPSPPDSCAYAGMPDFPSIEEQRRDNDVSSVASSAHTASTSFASRPILSPTPPSTRRRSPSPTRKQMMQLGQATPPVIFFQPGKENLQPEPVVELRTRLSKGMKKGIIPGKLKACQRLCRGD
jgi:hypothetical protein